MSNHKCKESQHTLNIEVHHVVMYGNCLGRIWTMPQKETGNLMCTVVTGSWSNGCGGMEPGNRLNNLLGDVTS